MPPTIRRQWGHLLFHAFHNGRTGALANLSEGGTEDHPLVPYADRAWPLGLQVVHH